MSIPTHSSEPIQSYAFVKINSIDPYNLILKLSNILLRKKGKFQNNM